MNPEDLTTHALGEPLSPADQAALEQALTSDASTRAEFEATQAFTSFLQQNLATDHPEATLTEAQKQNLAVLAKDRGASHWLARNPGDRAGRPTTLRWLTRTLLPLSAAALIVLGFQQWQKEDQSALVLEDMAGGNSVAEIREGTEDVVHITQSKKNTPLTPPDPTKRIVSNSSRSAISPPEVPLDLLPTPKQETSLAQSTNTGTIGHDKNALRSLNASISPNPPLPGQLQKSGSGIIAIAGTNTYTGSVVVSEGSAVPSVSIDGLVATKDYTRARVLNEVNRAWDSSTPVTVTSAPASPATELPILSQSGLKVVTATSSADGYVNLNEPAAHPHFDDRQSQPPTNISYTPIQENALTPVLREPLSTFSIDVDTASYANTRRFLNRSSLPPRDAVRIEELVNYFPYNLETPAPDSPHPFAVHVEVADCPWQPQHRLARVGIQGKKFGLEQRNSNFVFLIDVSGSMDQPDKLPLVKESLRLLIEQLDEKDRVSIVTYAGSSGLVLPPTNGDQKELIRAAIANMTSGGATHGSAGIQLAYEQAIASFIPEGVNRVILCSDGDFNVGISSPEELEKLITEKARSGVFLSVLGFGTGNLKDRTMETLADKGNGNYGYIDSLSEARKVLVEQMTGTLITIAKDVKIQVEFNPAQVASYRLIGYENRLLAKEDFNDETKDAGEIGAGHSVTALYEIVPVGVSPPTAPVDDLKYQTPAAAPAPITKPAATTSTELLTVKLRYKAPEGTTSQLIEVPVTDKKTTLAAATPEFKFTTAVAAYGLMLRQSSYRGLLSWDQIRQLALEGKGSDPHGYRAEFLQLLDKARGLQPNSP
jgi:autotransporter-associated beta strand protein